MPTVVSTQNPSPVVSSQPVTLSVTLLTGGGDRPYALGLADALTSPAVHLDFIGSDELRSPELSSNERVNFLNLRGDQNPQASVMAKSRRLLVYYLRLLRYAALAKPRIFHILWNNKIELFDRTLLMAYYKLLGKKIALTVHNVNIRKRDSNDSWLNRFSLKFQYRLSDHLFVHTEEMKSELISAFGVSESKTTVIPFGINNTVPNTALTSEEARRHLGIQPKDKTLLFFGNIAPYKGLEYLLEAFSTLVKKDPCYRLIVAGRPKGPKGYWKKIEQAMDRTGAREKIVAKIEFIPDEETEVFFKASDVLVLPYTHIFQSGVLFLGYSFGLPVIAADVGCLKGEIIEEKTGFVFKALDSCDLACKVEQLFANEQFTNKKDRRAAIKEYANDRYSWSKVAALTTDVYTKLSQ